MLSLVSKLFEKLLNALLEITLRVAPYNKYGDNLVSYISFVKHQHRLPTRKRLFNDVLYNIKTSDEILDPLRVFVTDKEFLKIFVKATVGDKYNVPTIDVITDASKLEGYQFPENCCIKPTHASGEVIIRQNNDEIEINKIKGWFNLNYYKIGREVNYKNLKQKVIVEPLIFDSTNASDYKFFCFNGKVKLIQVDVDRYISHRRALFNINWEIQNFSLQEPKPDAPPKKPHNFQEMCVVAEKLASYFNFVRIDLYSNGTDCLVGEITNVHGDAKQVFDSFKSECAASEIIFS